VERGERQSHSRRTSATSQVSHWLMSSVAALCLIVMLAVSCTDSSPREAPRSPGIEAPFRVRAADCSTGPWAEHCPEAIWARKVLRHSGAQPLGDTGSALTARAGRARFYFWAFPKARKRFPPENEPYRLAMKVNRKHVFSDGLRFAWWTQGLAVWLAAHDSEGNPTSPTSVIRLVTRASTEVPYSR
jgi:hypothetical protein